MGRTPFERVCAISKELDATGTWSLWKPLTGLHSIRATIVSIKRLLSCLPSLTPTTLSKCTGNQSSQKQFKMIQKIMITLPVCSNPFEKCAQYIHRLLSNSEEHPYSYKISSPECCVCVCSCPDYSSSVSIFSIFSVYNCHNISVSKSVRVWINPINVYKCVDM